MINFKRNKYHAKKCEYKGMKFDSAMEMERYKKLELLEAAGKITNLRRQVKFNLIPPQLREDGRTMRGIDYVADHVYEENGKTIVEDVKGFITEEFRIKEKLMKWCHNIEIRKVKR